MALSHPRVAAVPSLAVTRPPWHPEGPQNCPLEPGEVRDGFSQAPGALCVGVWELYPSQHCPGSLPSLPGASPELLLGKGGAAPWGTSGLGSGRTQGFWLGEEPGGSCWKGLESWNGDGDPAGNAELRGWNVSGVKCTLKLPAFHRDPLQGLRPRQPNLCAEGCE